MSMFQPMSTAFPCDTTVVAQTAQAEADAAIRNPAGRLTLRAVATLAQAREMAAKAERLAQRLPGEPCPDWQVVRYSAQASLDAVRAIVATFEGA